MAITFIPNDPDAADAAGSAPTAIAPSSDGAAGHSTITVANLPAEGEYPLNSVEFVAWQAREAALRAIAAFEEAYGALPGWRGVAANRQLPLVPVAGDELNAYYDRRTISMFRGAAGQKTVYSGASTDVVAHETGHAILDAIRPELFGVNMIEPGAFHEGFGDCIAVLTAFSDRNLRAAVLSAGADIRRENCVESLAEQLSAAIRVLAGPKHNAAAPRHAFNAFQWAFPSSLPMNGPPGTLINEEHSLGQLVGGIYYDLVAELLAKASAATDAKLWSAAKAAMVLVAKAAVRAPIKPRFFESWGRTMLTVDWEENGGKHEGAIRTAFERHGLPIGASNFLSPRTPLRRASTRKAPARRSARPAGGRIEGAALKSMKSAVRIALEFKAGMPLETRQLDFGKRMVTEVGGRHDVDLSGIDPRLEDVKAPVTRQTLVGEVDDGPAFLGAVDTNFAYDAEVRDFATSLIARGAIAFAGRSSTTATGAGFVASGDVVTHRVTTERGEKVLKRVAFRCGCGSHSA